MISPEVLAKIRHIEIHTRRLLSGMQVGDYSTAQKGSGLEFDQIREYQVGDDVRFIDWNSSARMNKMLVRQYLEERNRTVLLAVDVSPSTNYGSTATLKSELIAEIASILALVADYGKDAVGFVQYTKKIEKYMPPSRGRKHVHAIMQHLFEQANGGKNQPDAAVLPYDLPQLFHAKHKNAILVLLSDFIDTESLIETVGRAGKSADVIAIRCLDQLERKFPEVGILNMQSGHDQLPQSFDMSKKGKDYYNHLLQERLNNQDRMLRKYNINCLDVAPGIPFMQDLIAFFRRRMMY